MSKIKIVNIITDTNIGGAGKVLQNYLSHYDSKRFDVSVVLPAGSPLKTYLEGYGAKIIPFEKLAGKSMDIKSIFPMIQLLLKLKPDIVHTHASLSSRISARFTGNCKIIYTRHCAYPSSSFMKSGLGRLLGRLTAKLFSDRIIAISEAVKENLTETGVPETMIKVMMNGVEPMVDLSSNEKSAIRKKYDISEDEKAVGMVGRLEPVKGHEFFIKAAKKCIDKGMKVKFIIAGSGSIETELKELAANFGISDSVIFTGFLKNVAPVVNILDVFVNASYGTEASSIAMLEAMSLGKPVVATDYGGNPYQVRNEKTGLLVPIKDEDALSDSIMQLLNDSETYANYSKATKIDYNKKYTAAIMAHIIEKTYTSLVT
ncbi:MAG: glycosyltransferase [Clostridiales bacterium]|nr:glycosyltransferase [Clostridiales bacterium]